MINCQKTAVEFFERGLDLNERTTAKSSSYEIVKKISGIFSQERGICRNTNVSESPSKIAYIVANRFMEVIP